MTKFVADNMKKHLTSNESFKVALVHINYDMEKELFLVSKTMNIHNILLENS